MENYTFREDLPGILLLSHGPLCEAIVASARLIAGEAENIVSLPLHEEDSIDEYGDKAMTIFKSMPEGSVVLFDLQSGTPFNQMMMKSNGEKFPGLCGMNLPVVLEAMTMREFMSGDELIEALEGSAKDSIVNISSFFEF